MRLHFVLLTEGSSDEALLPHLENLCIDQGADEVTAIAPDFARLADRVGHTVEAKLAAAIELEPQADLIFIHRDADNRDPQPRYDEIAAAVAAAHLNGPYVSVVPVQETEAWLLLDERAIRIAAYRPNGTRALGLPRPQDVERRARPKEILQTALATASELTGRQLDHFKRDFQGSAGYCSCSCPLVARSKTFCHGGSCETMSERQSRHCGSSKPQSAQPAYAYRDDRWHRHQNSDGKSVEVVRALVQQKHALQALAIAKLNAVTYPDSSSDVDGDAFSVEVMMIARKTGRLSSRSGRPPGLKTPEMKKAAEAAFPRRRVAITCSTWR